MYRIYIQDRGLRLWLMDWIAADGKEHPQFTTASDYAMRFRRFDTALEYRQRMQALGYDPHIE